MPAELGGDGQEIFVMGYDVARQVYTFNAFSSQGRHVQSTGAARGNEWVWQSEASYEGESVQQRYRATVLSSTRYEIRFEICEDGKTWLTFMEGLATKR